MEWLWQIFDWLQAKIWKNFSVFPTSRVCECRLAAHNYLYNYRMLQLPAFIFAAVALQQRKGTKMIPLVGNRYKAPTYWKLNKGLVIQMLEYYGPYNDSFRRSRIKKNGVLYCGSSVRILLFSLGIFLACELMNAIRVGNLRMLLFMLRICKVGCAKIYVISAVRCWQFKKKKKKWFDS